MHRREIDDGALQPLDDFRELEVPFRPSAHRISGNEQAVARRDLHHKGGFLTSRDLTTPVYETMATPASAMSTERLYTPQT